MVGHGGSSAGAYLATPTSPIPSHCASTVVTSTLRVNNSLLGMMIHVVALAHWYYIDRIVVLFGACTYRKKKSFWEIIKHCWCTYIIYYSKLLVHLYSSRGARSLIGTCAKKRDNTVSKFEPSGCLLRSKLKCFGWKSSADQDLLLHCWMFSTLSWATLMNRLRNQKQDSLCFGPVRSLYAGFEIVFYLLYSFWDYSSL